MCRRALTVLGLVRVRVRVPPCGRRCSTAWGRGCGTALQYTHLPPGLWHSSTCANSGLDGVVAQQHCAAECNTEGEMRGKAPTAKHLLHERLDRVVVSRTRHPRNWNGGLCRGRAGQCEGSSVLASVQRSVSVTAECSASAPLLRPISGPQVQCVAA